MSDVRLHSLAAKQFNRLSRAQLEELGYSPSAIQNRLASGRLVAVQEGVYALPPVIESNLARWMEITLTAPGTYLNRLSAACAWGILEHRPSLETVVRAGSGGRQRIGRFVVYRSTTLEGQTTTHNGIPITSVPRTLLDLARFASEKALAKAVRDAIRLELATMRELGDYLGRCQGRKGCRRLAEAIGRYQGLPLERARSGAEIRALEILRDAGRPMPRLNLKVAGREADLVWCREKLIVEIDGALYHQDKGADAQKEGAWRSAGFNVERIPSDYVYERPRLLLAIAPNVAELSPKR